MRTEYAPKRSTKPQNEIEELFAQAVAFRRAAKLCYNLLLRTHSIHIGPPMLANTALATELVFKSLLQLRCGKYPRTHDLLRLYRKIPQNDQAKLTEMYLKRYISPDYALIFQVPGLSAPKTYEESVKLNRDVFVNFRYPADTGARRSAALAMTLDIAITYMIDIQQSLLIFKFETDDPNEFVP